VNWIFWAPLAAAGLHIGEEFVYPGGFMAWYRRYKSGTAQSITARFLVIINVLLLVACYDIGTVGPRPVGVAAWLTMMALLSANGAWHLRAAVRTRSYSPGVVTGLFLYLPLAAYGYVRFLKDGQASFSTAAAAFLIGASYQFWSNAFHSRRALRQQS
jgi:hypothetical protein